MRAILSSLALASGLLLGSPAAESQDSAPAKVLFSEVQAPADLQSRSIGSYSRGCLAGADPLPYDGPTWQVMRLTRNRNWGMPELVAFIKKFSTDAKASVGWPGLLIGDMSQPRGGPMPTGHASHQIGLDVDIWLDPMPDHSLTSAERDNQVATSYIVPGTHTKLNRALWTDQRSQLIKLATSYPEVERIFVNPGIKQELCNLPGRDRTWLRKVRPWYLHDDHFHVRLSCPAGMQGCLSQDPPPQGDGCGRDLAWWLSDAPYRPAPNPGKPAPPSCWRGCLTPAALSSPRSRPAGPVRRWRSHCRRPGRASIRLAPPQSLAPRIAAMTASVTIAVVARPPRSGVCRAGLATTRSIACMRTPAARFSPR